MKLELGHLRKFDRSSFPKILNCLKVTFFSVMKEGASSSMMLRLQSEQESYGIHICQRCNQRK